VITAFVGIMLIGAGVAVLVIGLTIVVAILLGDID
jgi:hypothetical protein